MPNGAPVVAVLCFSAGDRERVAALLREVGAADDPDVFVITVPPLDADTAEERP